MMDPELLAALQAIRDEVRALREELAPKRSRPQRRRDDPALVAELLRALVEAGDFVFTCAALLDHASLPQSARLHAAILAVIGDMSTVKLGKLFGRIVGHNFLGLCLHRINDAQSHTSIYQVKPSASGDQGITSPHPRIGCSPVKISRV